MARKRKTEEERLEEFFAKREELSGKITELRKKINEKKKREDRRRKEEVMTRLQGIDGVESLDPVEIEELIRQAVESKKAQSQ